MGFMRKQHRVQTAEASAVHNDVSASSTDLVRMGRGLECESKVSLRVVYCSIRVRMAYQYTSEGEYGMWWWYRVVG